jgi:predicted metal-binding membrane protein
MRMPPATSLGAAAGFVWMWLTMMAPMMLPSLMPQLWRYCRSVPAASALARHGLTALVGLGYFAVWALLALVIHAAAAALAGLEIRGEWLRVQPALIGAALLLAGAVQLSSWKARQLARCRDESACVPGPTTPVAWRYGLELGVQCALSCGNLMLALLALGMMNGVAMAAVTLAVTAERLAPAPRPVSRLAGVAIAAVGVLTMAAS